MVHTKDKPVYSEMQKYDSSSEDISLSEDAFSSKDPSSEIVNLQNSLKKAEILLTVLRP